MWGRSVCARCGAVIPLWRQIPIVSYCAGARVRRCCGGQIPKTYLRAEVASVAIGIAAAGARSLQEGAVLLLAGELLLYIGLVDLRRFVVPAEALAALAALSIIASAFKGDGSAALGASLSVAAAAVLAAWATAHKGARSPVPYGDVALCCILAGLVGWRALPTLVAAAAAAALIGAAALRRGGRIPFAPWLGAVGFAMQAYSTTDLPITIL